MNTIPARWPVALFHLAGAARLSLIVSRLLLQSPRGLLTWGPPRRECESTVSSATGAIPPSRQWLAASQPSSCLDPSFDPLSPAWLRTRAPVGTDLLSPSVAAWRPTSCVHLWLGQPALLRRWRSAPAPGRLFYDYLAGEALAGADLWGGEGEARGGGAEGSGIASFAFGGLVLSQDEYSTPWQSLVSGVLPPAASLVEETVPAKVADTSHASIRSDPALRLRVRLLTSTLFVSQPICRCSLSLFLLSTLI